jgi:hypothetical protein
MGVIAALRGTISVTDNVTGSTSLSKILNNAYTGDLSSFAQSLTVGTSPYTASLPNTLCEFLYIRNLSTNAGTTLTVTWTPTSGISAAIITLDPGALIIFSEVTVANGITALSMVSNQPGTPVEFIFVG